ncbi:unnamed protein product [Echinostoma caproni]|uniref:WD_REPEATS_REGION domain-containing protein n=1 Tax=Echinostoma caproni TaxID=27848 RepID=A0A183ADL5_9TREM|nr:unnamed protein product [Echinostoma caproni]
MKPAEAMYLGASDGQSACIWTVNPDPVSATDKKNPIMFSYDPRSGEPDRIRQMAWNPRTCRSRIGSDSFTLATGLINGEVWLYDIRALSGPLIRLTGLSFSVRHLVFALSLQSHDEVRFKDSVSIDRSLHPFALDRVSDENVQASSRPTPDPAHKRDTLGEITNRSNSPLKSPQDCQWNILFQDLSLPEWSSDSLETSRSSKQNTFQAPGLTHQSLNLTDSERNSTELGAECPPPCTPPIQTIEPPLPVPGSSKFTRTPLPKVEKQLESRLASLESNLLSELSMNQYQMLFYISRLEHAVQRMRNEFAEALTELHRENEALRQEVQRRSCFY